jgi:hypothetical protein
LWWWWVVGSNGLRLLRRIGTSYGGYGGGLRPKTAMTERLPTCFNGLLFDQLRDHTGQKARYWLAF